MAYYWIKLYHEVLHDPKMAKMSDHLWRKCIELFLMAGENYKDGKLPGIEKIAWDLRCEVEEMEADMLEFAKRNIVTKLDDGYWFVNKFAERQAAMPKSDLMRRKREAEHKEQYYQSDTNNNKSSYQPVTISNIDKITDKIKDKIIDNSSSSGELFTIFEQEIGHLTPMVRDKMVEALEEYPNEWIPEAIRLAVSNNVRKWSYVDGILKTWKVNGFQARTREPPGNNGKVTKSLLDNNSIPVEQTEEFQKRKKEQAERDKQIAKETEEWLKKTPKK